VGRREEGNGNSYLDLVISLGFSEGINGKDLEGMERGRAQNRLGVVGNFTPNG